MAKRIDMLKAGALYFAIVIAFFIAVVSASLIMLAAHYRNSYLKEVRYQRLSENLESGLIYVLSTKGMGVEELDLYGREMDSVHLSRSFWGIYGLAEMKVFIERDTMERNLLLGKVPDSVALYLADEDRPLSISGGTRITGNVQVPKSGLRQAYAEGKPYNGKELVYSGTLADSKRELPGIDETLIAEIAGRLEQRGGEDNGRVNGRHVSFGQKAFEHHMGKVGRLEDVALQGKIIVSADSVITIAASAKLNDILVYAPIIKVEAGFQGNCQLFASDSLLVEEQAAFDYPSVLGLVRVSGAVDQPQLSVGKGSTFAGTIFSYEKERSKMQTMVSLGAKVKVKGEVYCRGLLKLEKGVSIAGKVACNRFIMRTSQTLYENFLIDVAFNRLARSKYYLSSPLMVMADKSQVLVWLD